MLGRAGILQRKRKNALLVSSLAGDFGPSCGEHLGRSCFTAFEAATTAETDAGCILTFQQWRRFSILDLAAGDVDHQLGELRWIAGRLRRFSDMDQ